MASLVKSNISLVAILRSSLSRTSPLLSSLLGASNPTPTLTALALSNSNIAENSAAGAVVGSIQNLNAGSGLTLSADGGGRFTISGTALITTSTSTDYETAQSHSVTIVETLAGATGSPKSTTLTIAVVNQNDTNPASFSFTAASGATLAAPQTSNTITISGLSAFDSANVAISGDATSQLQKNGGSWVSGPLTVVNGDTLAVRHTSSGTAGATISTTLTVGTTSSTFTSTTSAGAVVYDTRFGTATDSQGRFTFDLHSGSRRVWVDSINGLDTNSGLTSAAPKQTLAAAAALFFNASYSPGDQLMVAGKGGRTYNDTGSTNGIGANTSDTRSGVSLAYPTALLSYDPTDASNATKYGKLVGNDMPVFNLGAGVLSVFSSGANGGDFIAIQGIEYYSNGSNNVAVGFAGLHNGICVQNCRFNGVQLSVTQNNNAVANTTINISQSSFRGAWNTNGNAQGVYLGGTAGHYIQDCAFIHCGWKIGVTRDEPALTGGPWFLGHGDYIHANSFSGNRVDRIVYADSAADGFNMRTNVAATQIVSIDDPIAGVLGWFSGDYTEAPNGILITVDDWVIMGGADTRSDLPRGNGPSQRNTLLGSYVRNLAMFDNPKFGLAGNRMFGGYAEASPEVDNYMLYDKVHAYGYSPTAFQASGVTSKVHTAWSNCLTDVLMSGGYNNDSFLPAGTGNALATLGSFPNYKTKMQVLSALGFSTKGAALDAFFFANHLPWAQAIHAIAMPAMGLTPQFATAAPPSLAGITVPAVYPTDETAPTLTSPIGASASTTSANIGVTTNEGNGKVYWVVSQDSRFPDPDNVRLGQDFSGTASIASGSFTVSSVGAKSATATGLTTGATYYAFFIHEDTVGNRSNLVKSAGFVPAAAGGADLFAGAPDFTDGTYNAGTDTITLSSNIVLGQWYGKLDPNSTYHFTCTYTNTSGSQMRIQDGSGNHLWTATSIGTSGSIDVSFSTTSSTPAGSDGQINTDSGLFTGTITNPVLIKTA